MIKFVGGFERVADLPNTQFPEYAFVGRSNVGKSSLINAVLGQNVARASNTPGRTQTLNLFNIDDRVMIVDLPGYGYARVSRDVAMQWVRRLEEYLMTRGQLRRLFVLVDSRHAPQKIDVEFLTWLGENEVPFSIVFTKLDKLGVEAGRAKVEAYKAELMKYWEELPPIFMSSSVDRRGRDEILDYIDSINKSL